MPLPSVALQLEAASGSESTQNLQRDPCVLYLVQNLLALLYLDGVYASVWETTRTIQLPSKVKQETSLDSA